MSKPSQRRGMPAIQVQTPKTKPTTTITMGEWDALAPLSELELKSISVVKQACERKTLPQKFDANDPGPSRPGTPNLGGGRGRGTSNSRPSTPVIGLAASRSHTGTHPLHPKQPVQTAQQFYDWFALIDRQVAHSQEAHFRDYVDSVAEHLEMCDALISRVEEINREVDGMLEGWRGVEEGGKSLKEASGKLLEERDRLIELTDEIGVRLDYFQELDRATRMLNHPGESLVLQDDFLYMVEHVDASIEYLRAHRHFKEAEVYLLRFHQCMTRAMTLIKMFFVGSLRALTSQADLQRRFDFRSALPQLAPLLRELERRAKVHPEDLSALLSDCHNAYFGARRSFVVGQMVEEIKKLDPRNKEIVELTRQGCGFLKTLCVEEFELFKEFFDSGEDLLYQYLEKICDYLYDDLRPRILHEPRLTALCDVCSVLQGLMIDDPGEQSAKPAEKELQLTIDLDKSPNRGLSRLYSSQLFQTVLQDAQTRLFFKAQSVIQSEIRGFAPKTDDLAYPDRIVAAKEVGAESQLPEKVDTTNVFKLQSMNKRESWYPTLQKTVWVLTHLQDFVNPVIFEDLAQEAINICRQSLVVASQLIRQRNPPTSIFDGQLFLVRHLLILKEIAHNLDPVQHPVEIITKSPTPMVKSPTNALTSILNRTTSLLPDALVASLGMPRNEESMTDVRHVVDFELRKACEEVIDHCSRRLCDPLSAWVNRVADYNAVKSRTITQGEPAMQLAAQPWALQAVAEQLNSDFRQACGRELKASISRLKLYLEDSKTVSVLLSHIQDHIMDDYGAFRDVTWGMYAGSLRNVVLSAAQLQEALEEICEEQL